MLKTVQAMCLPYRAAALRAPRQPAQYRTNRYTDHLQPQTQALQDLDHSLVARLGAQGKRLVEALPSKTGAESRRFQARKYPRLCDPIVQLRQPLRETVAFPDLVPYLIGYIIVKTSLRPSVEFQTLHSYRPDGRTA